MMAFSLRLSNQLVCASHRGKRFLRRQFFYNDNVDAFRPFDNTVELKLKRSAPLKSQENIQQTSEVIRQDLSSCGTVNGQCILNERRMGYFNFSSPQEKEKALALRPYNKKRDRSLPFTEIRDFEFGEHGYHRRNRPFRYLMIAAYRPSIHCASRISGYLEQFGPSNGVEEVDCPYDEDRRFLYFSYCERGSLTNRNISHGNCYIKGSEVCRDDRVLENSKRTNDVYLYPFADHDENRYTKQIQVRAENVVFSSRVKDFFNSKYDKTVEKLEKLGSDEGGGVRFLLTFRDRYPVYRMFYSKTPFGQVVETLPDTLERLYVTTPHLPKSIWKHNYLRMFNVPKLPEQDVLGFFNEFLNSHGMNPGIISVSQTTASYYSVDLKNRLLANPDMLDSPEQHDTYYELYFANPWHAIDVCHRLVLLNRSGVHDFHCAVDIPLYGTVRKFLNVEES